MEILKLISVNEIVAQLLCFLTVFFLLRLLLWKKFLKILDDRRQRIIDEVKGVEQTQAAVSLLKADFEDKLKNIDEIAASRLKETVAKGREAADDIRDRARQEAQRIVGEAKMEIEQTVTRTKEELKRQVVDLTILATEKMLSEKLTSEQDRQLAQKFVDQLERRDAA